MRLKYMNQDKRIAYITVNNQKGLLLILKCLIKIKYIECLKLKRLMD